MKKMVNDPDGSLSYAQERMRRLARTLEKGSRPTVVRPRRSRKRVTRRRRR